ncbi:CoA-binding protein [Clostridium estertheticum]|uniref:CoA-binding protein n=1 Tax=Clostridium estertheticum TaxID=238834 RepID=UPI00209B6725|nr:CoA-binding protein [Clostridium estertheticum]
MKANELLNYKNWVVVVDVLNQSKYAYKILLSLKTDGFNVVGVNPSIENKVYNKGSEYLVEVSIYNKHTFTKIIHGDKKNYGKYILYYYWYDIYTIL